MSTGRAVSAKPMLPLALSRAAKRLNDQGDRIINEIEALDSEDLALDPEVVSEAIEEMLDHVDGLVVTVSENLWMFEGAQGEMLLDSFLNSVGGKEFAAVHLALDAIRDRAGIAHLH